MWGTRSWGRSLSLAPSTDLGRKTRHSFPPKANAGRAGAGAAESASVPGELLVSPGPGGDRASQRGARMGGDLEEGTHGNSQWVTGGGTCPGSVAQGAR